MSAAVRMTLDLSEGAGVIKGTSEDHGEQYIVTQNSSKTESRIQK
jgi:hypothetical protein